MSYSASFDSTPPSLLVSNLDRVLVRAIPHPLASTNKRVTLSARRTAPGQEPPQPPVTTSPISQLSPTPASQPSIVSANPQTPTTQRNMISTLTSTILEQRANPSSCSASPALAAARVSDHQSDSVRTAVQPATISTIKYSAHFHKNGLPVKSAMKSPGLASNSKTSSNTPCRPSSIRSYSSPTPLTSPKYVHFNTQLEHVRLFLQGETPSCVAERETIVDARQHGRSTSDITLTLPNWTPLSADRACLDAIESDTVPLRVECAVLSDDQSLLCGKVLVKNLAFHKHVAVRYTADFWQTFSETTAEFSESIPGTALDRFTFKVPLDMERAAIEKTVCMAVKYQVVGREFWDSNNGMNYQVECKRVVVVAPPSVPDLSKQMTSLLLGSPLPDYSKPVLKKKLANRYDLSTSLSAAYNHPSGIQTRVGIFPGGSAAGAQKPSPPASHTAYRPSEYIAPSVTSPQIYHHSLYASSPKFLSTYLSAAASPPDYQLHVGFDPLTLDNSGSSKRGTRNSWNMAFESAPAAPSRSQSYPSAGGHCSPYASSPRASSSPISIPSPKMQANRPAAGSSSYFDLVDRYCFYESSPHTSPYSSYPNSPPAPCIRG
ncbi:unnamed protein product [Mortierella alpina]